MLAAMVCLLTSARAGVCAEEKLRDPFLFGSAEVAAPTTTAAQTPKSARLIGVLWDAKNPLALIDGEPVRIGQQVKGWRIITMQPDRVVIQRGDRKETLMTGDAIPVE